jgi:hypothetical protein
MSDNTVSLDIGHYGESSILIEKKSDLRRKINKILSRYKNIYRLSWPMAIGKL